MDAYTALKVERLMMQGQQNAASEIIAEHLEEMNKDVEQADGRIHNDLKTLFHIKRGERI